MDPRRMCPNCRAFITTRDKVCPYCEAEVGPRAVDIRNPNPILGGLIPHARFATMMILLVNAALYLGTVFYSMQRGNEGALFNLDGRTLFDFGAKYAQAVWLGQWWRLVTAGFLHGGLLHILMNTWVLYDLGAQVEEVYGSARLLVLYFVSTVAGFFASALWSPALSVGASAALFGFIGAMIALGVRRNTALGSALRAHYMRWAIYGLLFGLLPGLAIDNAAHLGGLVAGFATAYLSGEPNPYRKGLEKFWRAAAGACVAVTAVCFLYMVRWMTGSAS